VNEPATHSVGTTIGRGAARALARWRLRVRIALLLGGFVDGVAAVAIVGVAALLVLRLFGVAPFTGLFAGTASPSPWWAALFAVPVLAALIRLRRADPSDADVALHVDRRLETEGLLLFGLEQDAPEWTTRLDARLGDVTAALPRMRWGRLVARAALPLAALAGVLLLPPPASAPDHEFSAALNSALDRFEKRLEEIKKNEGLHEEAKQELSQRLETMKDRNERGEPPSWSDLDTAQEKMDRETNKRAAELLRAKAEMGAFSDEKHGDPSKSAADREAMKAEMAALLDDAEKAGLLDSASREAAAKAGLDPDSGAPIDSKRLSGDAATLAALAKALEATAGQRLEGLAKAGAISLADLEALKKLMEGDPIAAKFTGGAEVCPECHGDRPEGCGG
jgi:hypothetical protein